MVLVIFFVFGPFLGTNIDVWVPKMRFSKMEIFGVSIESEWPGMVSS